MLLNPCHSAKFPSALAESARQCNCQNQSQPNPTIRPDEPSCKNICLTSLGFDFQGGTRATLDLEVMQYKAKANEVCTDLIRAPRTIFSQISTDLQTRRLVQEWRGIGARQWRNHLFGRRGRRVGHSPGGDDRRAAVRHDQGSCYVNPERSLIFLRISGQKILN